ncbi:hypothetical protein [Cohnella sp. GCM10027633]|uniref:hypothetical protein n=1 Tax=unclassified Cohnella TaxID=2636738 RepID=UPI00363FD328
MDKLIRRLILLFIVFSAIPFLPEALTDIALGSASYAKFTNESLLPIDLQYAKDFLLGLLLLVIILRDFLRRSLRTTIALGYTMLLIAVYGTYVLTSDDNTFRISMVLAGARPLFLLMLCFKLKEFLSDRHFISALLRTLKAIIALEWAVISAQYFIFIHLYGATNPFSLRLIGTFGSFSIAGYFAVGCACILYMLQNRAFLARAQTRFVSGWMVACFMIASLSGTRTAIFGCLLVLLASWARSLLSRGDRRRNRMLLTGMLFLSAAGMYYLLQLVSLAANRGSVIESQWDAGRVSIIANHFANSSLFQILFGKGIGYGTNMSVMLESQYGMDLGTEIVDGTLNSIIMQYGVVMMTFAVLWTALWASNTLRTSKAEKGDALVIASIGLLMCMATNIFEQYSFLVLFSVSCYLIGMPFVRKEEDTRENSSYYRKHGAEIRRAGEGGYGNGRGARQTRA